MLYNQGSCESGIGNLNVQEYTVHVAVIIKLMLHTLVSITSSTVRTCIHLEMCCSVTGQTTTSNKRTLLSVIIKDGCQNNHIVTSRVRPSWKHFPDAMKRSPG